MPWPFLSQGVRMSRSRLCLVFLATLAALLGASSYDPSKAVAFGKVRVGLGK
jgi:hypothetical protein